MTDENKYNIRTNFLPREGIIYVDTCGFEWVCQIDNWDVQSEIASLRRLKSFCETFQKRGYVSTNEGVLEEIKKSKDYWIKKKKGIKKIRRYFMSGGNRRVRKVDNSMERYKFFSEWLKANNRMYDILKKGIELYSPRYNGLNHNGVEKFVENYPDLSGVDKGLVCMALKSGSGNGILSADSSLLKVYRYGVNEFNLKKCFICDSMNSKTLYL